MSNCICAKCGAEAYSKCPECRSVFPENQTEALLATCLNFKDETDKTTVVFKIAGDRVEALQELSTLLLEMRQGLRGMPGFKTYACDHDWRFKPGERSSIGCGH